MNSASRIILLSIAGVILAYLLYLIFHQVGVVLESTFVADSGDSEAAFILLFKHMFVFIVVGCLCWIVIKRSSFR